MAYLINPEDQDILDSVREFCENEIKEQCKEYDVSGEWPKEIYDKAGELGYFGLEVPEEYGGLGLERITAAAIMEEFHKADAGFGSTITASTPLRLAPSTSVRSLSPSMAVCAGVTPAFSMACR